MCCGFSGFRAPRAAALAVPLAALFDVDPGEELMVAVAWSVEGSLEMARVGGVNRDRLDQLVDGLERKLGQEKAVGREILQRTAVSRCNQTPVWTAAKVSLPFRACIGGDATQ